MKRILSLLIIALFVVTLAACGNGNDIPDDILDCIEDPSDPDCEIPTEIDCLLTPTDPTCIEEVDCTVTPNDPTCIEEVDCTVTPNDPTCIEEVDCTVTPNDPTCIVEVDCTVTPNDPSCPLVCPDGEHEILGFCILIDNRTPEEILADAILANWDGGLSHLETVMDTLDLEDGLELTTELNLEVIDGSSETHQVNVVVHDTYVFGDYTILQRLIEVDFDGEIIEFEIILEEVETGVRIYYNTDFLRGLLLTTENDPEGNIQDVLDSLDANGQWFLFKFDDSLSNIVELAVLKDMLREAFYEEFGMNYFYHLQDDAELETGLDFSDYNMDFGLFMDEVFAEDWTAAETMINSMDFELLIADLDIMYLVPELVAELEEARIELEANYTFDVDAQILQLESNGTMYWLEMLTEADVLVLLDYYAGEPVAMLYQAYLDDEVEEFLIMALINETSIMLDLENIPGLDTVALELALENLDFDALELEMPDLSGLPQAVYEGQVAFDAYIVNLAIASPEHAAILAPFSGLVAEGEEYMVYIDDLMYGFENLDMFAEYFDAAYYIENDIVVFGLTTTPEFDVATTITLDVSESTSLFMDLMADAYLYADGFESFEMPFVEVLNCPAGETECVPFEEYAMIVGNLAMLGDTVITFSYNPMSPDDMETNIDFTSFFNSLWQMDDNTDGSILDASITITVSETDGITLPAEAVTTDLNVVAEEFARFSLALGAYNYLEEMIEYELNNPTITTTSSVSINSYSHVFLSSFAFDSELSTFDFDFTNPSNPTYEIDLYWLDGTSVFDAPLGWQELLAAFGPGSGMPARATYEAFIEEVDEDNFSMTKLLLVYLWDQGEPEMPPMP